MLEKGTYIGEKYEVLDCIGKGGMSSVYLVRKLDTEQLFAMKAFDREETVLKSAIAELKVLKKVSYPMLPKIETMVVEKDAFYIVMEYIKGETLQEVVAREGAQSLEHVIAWTKELCEVLAFLHTRKPPIIYRDMKPANIMLLPDGKMKLIDFGIAREYKEKQTEDTLCFGTKGYAAPEQFYGMGQTDARTDIYGLGATMYYLLTGQKVSLLPFERRPLHELKPEIPREVEIIIQKCLKTNPMERYQSATLLRDDLKRYEREQVKKKIEHKKQRRKRRARLLFDVLLVVILLFEIRYCSKAGLFTQVLSKLQEGMPLLHRNAIEKRMRYVAIAFVSGTIFGGICFFRK